MILHCSLYWLGSGLWSSYLTDWHLVLYLFQAVEHYKETPNRNNAIATFAILEVMPVLRPIQVRRKLQRAK